MSLCTKIRHKSIHIADYLCKINKAAVAISTTATIIFVILLSGQILIAVFVACKNTQNRVDRPCQMSVFFKANHNVASKLFIVDYRGNDNAIYNRGTGRAVAYNIAVIQQLEHLVNLLFVAAAHCVAQCLYAELGVEFIVHKLAVIGHIFDIIGLICRKHRKKTRGKAVYRNGFGIFVLLGHFNRSNALRSRLLAELFKHRI